MNFKPVFKRMAALALLCALTIFALSGCAPLVEDDESIAIYATFYPIYALTEALTRSVPDVELHCLVQSQDGCLRNYVLSDWDLALLKASADAVVMGGRGLEDFESTLFGLGEDGPAASAVLYNLPLYNASQSHASSETESHLEGPNPHLYMSLDGAAQMIDSLAAALVSLDPGYAERYLSNADAAKRELETLSDACREALQPYQGRRVILMNEALIYVAKDYDLEVADWIDRESGVAFYDVELERCLERLSAANAEVILIERQAPERFCKALDAAGFAVAKIDVLSTHREGEGFDAYLQAQRENAEAIRAAFESGGNA